MAKGKYGINQLSSGYYFQEMYYFKCGNDLALIKIGEIELSDISFDIAFQVTVTV